MNKEDKKEQMEIFAKNVSMRIEMLKNKIDKYFAQVENKIRKGNKPEPPEQNRGSR